jgi:hypothetical protein
MSGKASNPITGMVFAPHDPGSTAQRSVVDFTGVATSNFTCERDGLPSVTVSATDPYAFVSSVGVMADSLRLRVGGRVAVQRRELVVGVRAGAEAQPQRAASDAPAATKKRSCICMTGWSRGSGGRGYGDPDTT